MGLNIIPDSCAALPEAFHARHLIGGVWRAGGATRDRVSPSHGTVASRAEEGTAADARAAVAAARTAFDDGRWARLPGRARAAVLLRVADLIARDVERLALIETLESGKPIAQARGEVGGAADLWRHAAAMARASHGEAYDTLGPDMLALTLRGPRGVVGIITPWNFPFWILSQKLPYALAAGCTVVVKPSEMTPSSTVMLGALLQEAGLPDGVANIVLGSGASVGAALVGDGRVDMVSFTGSTAVGRTIAREAGGRLARVALELGGKNPQVVFPDADLESAADAVAFGAVFNAGQCCNAGSRVLVQRGIAEEFTARVAALSGRVAFGDPLDARTQVGAIVTPEHGAAIDGHVRAAVAAGAEVRLGGGPLAVPGLAGQFYQPTVLAGLSPGLAVVQDEVFGPVLAVQTFETLDEAIGMANATPYGLSAGVWSGNIHTCLDFARRVQAGTVWTNTWMDGYPEVTFGGMKQSGLGREIGRAGFEEYQEIKSLVMRIGRTRVPWVTTP